MSQILQKVAPIGESRDREILKSASTYIYATRESGALHAHVFFPAGEPITPRPAVAFFHGGFWDASMPTQFVPHCHHFASRGAVSITFEYRTNSSSNTGPIDALEDAAAAIVWLQENADTFNIDPENIVFSGAAGGAFLALVLAMRKDPAPSIKPKALMLFSALVNTTPKGQLSNRFPTAKMAKQLSPSNLLRRKLPPMVFLHGRSDRVTPFEEIATFCRRLKWRRNKCKLIDFTGGEHSFFNFNVNHQSFEVALRAADHFLVEHGVLAPAPAEDS